MKKGIISHVELYVSNLDDSREFWSPLLEALGYKLFQVWNKGVSYILNDTYIVFVQTEEKYKDIPYHRKRTGLNHLAFYVDTKEELKTIETSLKNSGTKFLYTDRYPENAENYYAIFFEDPDRIKVEIVVTPQ